MEVFKLFGSILVKTDEAEKSISSTTAKAQGFGEKLGNGIKTAAKWGAAVVAAATAVGTAMVAATKATATNLDTVDKASQRMGIDAESYQELAYAADLSGVSMSTMERAAKSLMDQGMDLNEAIDQINAVEDSSERTALAVQLLGEKAAYEMAPLFNQGSEGMEAMRKEARDLGLVIDGQTVKSGANLNDMFTKVETSLKTLKDGLVADLMPYVSEILQWVIDNVPTIRETIKGVANSVIPIVKPILNFVMESLPPILNAIKKLLDWIMPYLTPVLESIGKLFDGFSKLFQGDLKGFAEAIKNILVSLGKALFGIGKDIFNALWDGIKSVWESIKNWVSEKVSWLTDKLAFWKKGKADIDGSHAAGLSTVPYDGYTAVLHKGETILNKKNSESLVEDVINALSGIGGSQTINLVVDGETLAKVSYNPLQDLTRKNGVCYG